ncbi:MAG TPA: hypothetical protein VF924_08970, partial [Stellaceae bacterium]
MAQPITRPPGGPPHLDWKRSPWVPLVGVMFTVTSASPDGNGQGATLSLLVGAGFAPAGALASGGVSPSRAGAAALI